MSIKLDFQVIETHDPKILMIADSSDWGVIEGKPSIIEIVLPGEELPVTQYFKQKKLNIFNSSNLGLSCSECGDSKLIELPDGIYFIKIKGSPDSYFFERSYLKTDNTRLSLDKYIMSITNKCTDYSKEVMDKIQKAIFYLEAAESNARLENYCQSQDLLFSAQKLIENLSKCKTCC